MRALLFLALTALVALPACKTSRTVLAGPQNPDMHVNDYDAVKESVSSQAGEKAAAMGMVGSQFGGGAGWGSRFGNADPYGYNRTDKDGKVTLGLNALGEKYFGGNTKTKDMKSFSQTKDFLTKRYSNTRELGQKESVTQRMSSWLGGKKANVDRIANETGQTYRDGARVLANKSNYNEGRTVPERTATEGNRAARTKDYYPAQKAVDDGRDAPRMIGNADKDTAGAVTQMVNSHSRDKRATVDEIRQLLGKKQ